jgi:hypothetical protein
MKNQYAVIERNGAGDWEVVETFLSDEGQTIIDACSARGGGCGAEVAGVYCSGGCSVGDIVDEPDADGCTEVRE